jgi:hypothetical protein
MAKTTNRAGGHQIPSIPAQGVNGTSAPGPAHGPAHPSSRKPAGQGNGAGQGNSHGNDK